MVGLYFDSCSSNSYRSTRSKRASDPLRPAPPLPLSRFPLPTPSPPFLSRPATLPHASLAPPLCPIPPSPEPLCPIPLSPRHSSPFLSPQPPLPIPLTWPPAPLSTTPSPHPSHLASCRSLCFAANALRRSSCRAHPDATARSTNSSINSSINSSASATASAAVRSQSARFEPPRSAKVPSASTGAADAACFFFRACVNSQRCVHSASSDRAKHSGLSVSSPFIPLPVSLPCIVSPHSRHTHATPAPHPPHTHPAPTHPQPSSLCSS